MNADKRRAVFQKYVPDGAVDYCYNLWKELNFDFKISRSRQSKYGDYRYNPHTNNHTITVNHDQNPYAFLITYIHEVAHKVNFDLHQNKVNPHGREWKHQFKKLMIPMLREEIFPIDVLHPLARHMKNPKASSTADRVLFEALQHHNAQNSGTLLKQIEIGGKFLFRKKIYRKLELRRTRSLCEQVDSGKKYLISESAPVKAFQN